MFESTTLTAFLLAAVSAGTVHTIAGPDHYVPLIAVAKLRSWSRRRAIAATGALGFAHCATSAALALAIGAGATTTDHAAPFEAVRGAVVAWLLLGLGVGLALRGIRRRLDVPARAPWLLALALAIGPCEWLVPAVTTTAAAHGTAAACLVAGVFTAATVTTMVLAVTVGLTATARWRTPAPRLHVLAASIAACGVAVLAGF